MKKKTKEDSFKFINSKDPLSVYVYSIREEKFIERGGLLYSSISESKYEKYCRFRYFDEKRCDYNIHILSSFEGEPYNHELWLKKPDKKKALDILMNYENEKIQEMNLSLRIYKTKLKLLQSRKLLIEKTEAMMKGEHGR